MCKTAPGQGCGVNCKKDKGCCSGVTEASRLVCWALENEKKKKSPLTCSTLEVKIDHTVFFKVGMSVRLCFCCVYILYVWRPLSIYGNICI